jgi:predicted nuclease of predicted toxin-antitoxin system
MKIYLDDDMASSLLAQLLRNAGHDVCLPADIGLVGAEDAVHFRNAALDGRSILTANHDVHRLVVDLTGHHPGVLVVRKDNDPKRDLKAPGIVRALRNFIAANAPIADQFVILNHWR